jgi:phosphoribosylformylglycinamidine synthase
VPTGFVAEGLRVVLLGDTREEFGGSEWAHVAHRHLGGLPPRADLQAEQALATVLVEAARRGLLEGSHDLSDGGLAVALAESCLARGVGASVALSGDAFTDLFSESAARALVTVRPEAYEEFASLCGRHEVPCYGLGTTGGASLVVEGVFEVQVEELRETHSAALPALFG